MNFSVKELSYFDIVQFNNLFDISFPEFRNELQQHGYIPSAIDYRYVYDNLIYPAIAEKLVVLLYDNNDLIGYELMCLSEQDKSVVQFCYTYILQSHRGKKLSFLLRRKMYEIAKNKNIKKVYFTVSNSNQVSINNLKSFVTDFKVTEISKTYLLEL